MHPFMSSVLFGMAGDDPFDPDAEADPPQRKSGKPRQSWRSEGAAVIRQDGQRQTVLAKDDLERSARVRVLGRSKRSAREDEAADVVDDRQGVAVPVIEIGRA